MMNGYWILLEDIDMAPADVLSMLIPVLETKTLTLPGRSETIVAAPGFQLFATQRYLLYFYRFYQTYLETRSREVAIVLMKFLNFLSPAAILDSPPPPQMF